MNNLIFLFLSHDVESEQKHNLKVSSIIWKNRLKNVM